VFVDLEKPFQIQDAQYDYVLCINVLEHIFNYQNVIAETKRILKPGGQAIIAVPFLIQVHPSPHDHWRFTGETLERLFTEAGFTEVKVEAIGTGVFGAATQLKFNILQVPFIRAVEAAFSSFLDSSINRLFKGSMYSKDFYPLGYVVQMRKD
jgi:SAM-dependent methyltransferase